MRNTLLLLLLPTFAVSPASVAEELSQYQKGQLAGSLGFGAMALDAYYEICWSDGARTDNYLNGIDKIMSDKWGVTFTEIAKEQEARSGRDHRNEAHTLVRTTVEKFGSCDSDKMNNWFKLLQDNHENNLTKFHSTE